jgi:hypothetical protein
MHITFHRLVTHLIAGQPRGSYQDLNLKSTRQLDDTAELQEHDRVLGGGRGWHCG